MTSEVLEYYTNRVRELESAIKWHVAWSTCMDRDLSYNVLTLHRSSFERLFRTMKLQKKLHKSLERLTKLI